MTRRKAPPTVYTWRTHGTTNHKQRWSTTPPPFEVAVASVLAHTVADRVLYRYSDGNGFGAGLAPVWWSCLSREPPGFPDDGNHTAEAFQWLCGEGPERE